ncbi:MAG TPA: glycoside hydrolase domain-containing protein, partial [Isosphaeraceae bacterium]|nr:glycoside hydrolase domain-containing protein [Isosphaeraceae bacterium]
SGGVVVAAREPGGHKALRIDGSYVSLDQPQNWLGYDFLKADLDTDAPTPMNLTIEIRDAGSRDYWTRVNYDTVVPPGRSTLILPLKQLYVGEKSKPGRALILDKITRLVFSIGERPAAPLKIENVRLERDLSTAQIGFAGLHAFDFGTNSSPVMEGFTAVTPATQYSPGRGYGLKNAQIWRAIDALQPDPLYQDFLCTEAGGLAVDLPNGKYRVFVNINSPSGYWGESQTYRSRSILAEGLPVVNESMDFEAFKARYYRFWNVEDRPNEVTFDKYQKTSFDEKRFDVVVSDGQLNLDFQGENWACSVSAVVIFPVEQAARGQEFLDYVQAKRRFYFDNYFKRVLHPKSGVPLRESDEDRRRGYVVFQRNYMQDVFYNDGPSERERGDLVSGEAFAGEYEPVTISVVPLRGLGKIKVSVSDLTGPDGTIPSTAIDLGFVSYRITRGNLEGTVYSIQPRLIMPDSVAEVPEGLTRRFWLTIRTPADARPGVYKGTVTIQPEAGAMATVPLGFRVRTGTLDLVDIPAGPFGFRITLPWFGDDRQASRFNAMMAEKSLRKMREYGFTAFSGLPSIAYKGFTNRRPVLDFRTADPQMKFVKDLGFLAVVSYGGGLRGIDDYYQDTRQMTAAGFKDYAGFIKAVYREIQEHADRNGWVPVYFNIADEPGGADLVRSAENAEAYRKAFPKGPPYFTAATSFSGGNRQNPAFRLSRALHVPAWNIHDEASVNLIHQVGGDWAFYNSGDRWTYGIYMYKAAKEHGMKFRIAWHWNNAAGDPYYALDCREDDFAWCNSSPDGGLIPSVDFERLREGLDDYRRLLTLSRLATENSGNPAAKAANELIATRLAAFHLGQRNHDRLFPPDDWSEFRRQVDDLIEALRK